MCNRICSKPVHCGHTCDSNKPCSQDHICTCACKIITEEALKYIIEDEKVPESVEIQEMSEKERLRQKMVQDYRAFANGGAQEQDARLHARENARIKGKRRNFTTKIAIGDLLGVGPLSIDADPVGTGSSGAREQEQGDSNWFVQQGSLLD